MARTFAIQGGKIVQTSGPPRSTTPSVLKSTPSGLRVVYQEVPDVEKIQAFSEQKKREAEQKSKAKHLFLCKKSKR